MTKSPATHFVARARRASRDFCLFLERNVSDLLPLSAPRPEFFPDCSEMMHISEMLNTSWIIRKMIDRVFMGVRPFLPMIT